MRKPLHPFRQHGTRRILARVLVTACAYGIVVCGLTACGMLGPSAGSRATEQTRALREVLATELTTIQGTPLTISDQRGKIVMLHFFSSWCRECSRQAPSLARVHSSFKGTPFQLIAIDVGGDPFEARTFANHFQLPFPVALDISGELKSFFSITVVPSTLFLDSDGYPLSFKDPQTGAVSAKIEGVRAWDTAGPIEMIAGLVEGVR
jgi:peroxiredoxin